MSGRSWLKLGGALSAAEVALTRLAAALDRRIELMQGDPGFDGWLGCRHV